MSCIVHIETAADRCSVALSQDGAVLTSQRSEPGERAAQVLPRQVEDMVSFADSHAIPLDAVALSAGPGSYTGLRIGCSTAKGLCFGRDLRLIAVPTLSLMCVPLLLYRDDLPDDVLLCPMLDARRMEVYAQLCDRSLREVMPTQPVVVDETSWADVLEERPVWFFGPGAAKCEKVIRSPRARFIAGIEPEARHMVPLAEQAHARGVTEDVSYFEPNYLKEFIAGKPKRLL